MIRLLSIAFLVYLVHGQDYLTCLKNNEAFAGFTNQDAPGNIRGPSSYPGKRGSPGNKGEVGEKGSKGEPFLIEATGLGVDDLVNMRKQLDEALHKVAALCEVAPYQQPDDGWYAPSNGYQYKVMTSTQSWEESRRLCQDLSGDLAAVGMRDLTIRENVGNALLQSIRKVWIGISDNAQEGEWVWIDGEVSSREVQHWHPHEPQGGRRENCAVISWPNVPISQAVDVPCSTWLPVLCEKPLPKICG
ncbi:alpha-N-acetylgalactosamine-specific lectin-like [Clavelina lepadiformis]|uniref:alpha-N-acetylgalactosamine-specific lectin-like n=1 Tax=Clavelina lepadiformis TaxID=159417 RepID=UPI00404292A8